MSPTFPARLERFASVDSTQTVVRRWLEAGTPEVAVAVADEQTAGRGRLDRAWTAPSGSALLCSCGFRPSSLEARHAWRLGAVVSLAMLDAAEDVAGLREGRLRLKWPNDLVIAPGSLDRDVVRKVAGVLGETDGLGTAEPRAVIGIGVNTDWPATDFPPDLAATMTSLREAADGRAIDTGRLLDAFLGRLEARVQALRGGRFDGAGWADRQVTTGRTIRLETSRGVATVRALGVDSGTGALVVANHADPTRERRVLVGEVRHVRLAEPLTASV